MRNQKLTYRFHDPNPPGVAADYILKVLIEANAPKAEQAIREAMAATAQPAATAKPDEPGILEWAEESDEVETLGWDAELEEPEEREEMESEKCQSQSWDWAMAMM